MKKILCLFLTAIVVMGSLVGCGKQSGAGGTSSGSGKTPVVLNEVAHSMKCADKSNMHKTLENTYF